MPNLSRVRCGVAMMEPGDAPSAGRWRTSVVDARGRRVPLVQSLTTIANGDPDRAARLNAVARMPKAPPTAAQWLKGIAYGALWLPVLAGAALLPAWLAFRTSLPWWAQIMAAIPIGALPALAIIFVTRRIAANAIARDCVRAGYCASCGQDLTGLPRADDGCLVCPECGAAWRGDDHEENGRRAQGARRPS